MSVDEVCTEYCSISLCFPVNYSLAGYAIVSTEQCLFAAICSILTVRGGLFWFYRQGRRGEQHTEGAAASLSTPDIMTPVVLCRAKHTLPDV